MSEHHPAGERGDPGSPQSRNELILQHEVLRTTAENLELRERIESLEEQLKKLNGIIRNSVIKVDLDAESEQNTSIQPELTAIIRKKDRQYLGMFEYQKEDEVKILRQLILELKPKVAFAELPGLPAYILFMCIRYTDYMNDDEKVRSLLTNGIGMIKKIIYKKSELNVSVLWLSNILRLLHTLKQYSGDAVFQKENTQKQNEQCLKNFDLAEYRQVLSDLAVWVYTVSARVLKICLKYHPIVPVFLRLLRWRA